MGRLGAGAAGVTGASLLALALLLALAEFGQVWYYPPVEAGAELVRAHGGAFRLTLWLAASAAIAASLLRGGLRPTLRALWPFLPFIAWGALVAALWTVDRGTSLRSLVFWSLAAGLAVAAGNGLEPRRLARGVALLFVTVIALSLGLALVRPEAATTVYGDGAMVRGLFPHKNAFGWFSALGLIWAVGTRGLLTRRVLAALGLAAVAGLAASGSKTALLVLPGVAAYALALRVGLRVFGGGARGAVALLLAGAVAVGVAGIAAPRVVEALGRDATLTGRTEVWRHYLAHLRDRPLTGYGTGVLSTDSELNRALGAAVPGQEGQGLRSPHSLYIGLASEVGVVGLALFLAAQTYVALVAPFRRTGPWTKLAGAFAVAILLAGVAEMRDGFGPGTATLLLFAARAAGLRGSPAGSAICRERCNLAAVRVSTTGIGRSRC